MNTLTRTVAAALFVLPVLIGVAAAQESQVVLKAGAGKEKVTAYCAMCHSLDYIPMNSPFLDKAGWNASVTKMINVFGAPIPKEDVETIVNYLALNYGKPTTK